MNGKIYRKTRASRASFQIKLQDAAQMLSANLAKFFKTHFLQNTSVNNCLNSWILTGCLKLAIHFYIDEIRNPDTKI